MSRHSRRPISIRLAESQRAALEAAAAELHTSVSELARELLARGLTRLEMEVAPTEPYTPAGHNPVAYTLEQARVALESLGDTAPTADAAHAAYAAAAAVTVARDAARRQ